MPTLIELNTSTPAPVNIDIFAKVWYNESI